MSCENTPRYNWLMALVLDICPGKDGIVQKVLYLFYSFERSFVHNSWDCPCHIGIVLLKYSDSQSLIKFKSNLWTRVAICKLWVLETLIQSRKRQNYQISSSVVHKGLYVCIPLNRFIYTLFALCRFI